MRPGGEIANVMVVKVARSFPELTVFDVMVVKVATCEKLHRAGV